MSNRTSIGLLLASVLMTVTVVAGCGESGSGGTSDLGDWTLRTEGLTLAKELQVSETEAFYFGRIIDLDVTSEGQMVVADRDALNIKVLRPDGTLIDTLGRSGEGPGEFQQLRSVQVARGDSIYAYDVQRSRLTVFGPPPRSDVERILTIPREQGFATQVVVLGDRLVGTFGAGITPDDGVRQPEPNPWRRIDGSGTPGDTLMMARGRKRALKSLNGGFRIRPIPFARETLTAVGPDSRLYYGWTDSLRISGHASDGPSKVVASVPTEPIPVRTADRDSALSNTEGDMKSMVASALPATKPAFTDLVVADDGRLWVRRPTETPDPDMVPWWVLDPENQVIQIARLPDDVSLEVVTGEQAFGTTTTEMGAPAVVRYEINFER